MLYGILKHGMVMEGKMFKIQDILDLGYLQKVQDSFAKLANITTVIVDKEGLPITNASNLYGFCNYMQSRDKPREKCIKTNLSLIGENNMTKKPAVLVCPHSGLITASIPILINGDPVAYWIVGQLKMEEPTDDIIVKMAQESGEDLDVLKALMKELPTYTQEKFEPMFDYFETLSSTLVKIGQANYDTKIKNEKLLKLTHDLNSMGHMLTIFADSTDVSMFVVKCENDEVIIANKQICELVGIEKKDLVLKHLDEICKQNVAFNLFSKDLSCTDCVLNSKINDEYYFEFDCRWWKRTIQEMEWMDGTCVRVVSFSDITRDVLTKNELSDLAYYDRDMHLPNLLKLSADMEKPENKDGYLVCFDIKQLRRINDSYGRDIGDVLLGLIVDWVYMQIGEDDAVYRTDGDEFCVLLNNIGIDKAWDFAKTVEERFEKEWRLKFNNENVYIFSGVTLCIIDGKVEMSEELTLKNLIERAMDSTKKDKTIAVYNDDMDRKFREHLEFEVNFKNSVNQGMKGFYLYFHPIVDVKSGRWMALEALCRWESSEFGYVPPEMFIDEAEKLGLIEAVGNWVLEEAIKQCKAWKLDEIDGFVLDVNFSAVQIANGSFDKMILDVLSKYNFPGKCLCMEITESMELVINHRIRDALENLRDNDVSVALDDFGIGYSSFQSLKNLPVNTIKTEREFVRDIETDVYLRNLFKLMVDLAHLADKKLIAEGVETDEQLSIVLESGADLIQGYIFEKPMSCKELSEKLYKFNEVEEYFLN